MMVGFRRVAVLIFYLSGRKRAGEERVAESLSKCHEKETARPYFCGKIESYEDETDYRAAPCRNGHRGVCPDRRTGRGREGAG